MKRLRLTAISVLALALGAGACVGLAGCDSFERNAFKTLSASKAVVDEAQTDYESGLIAKNNEDFTAINDLKAVQATAVQALESYDALVQAKASSSAVTAQQAVVQAALNQLPQLVAAVQALIAAVKGAGTNASPATPATRSSMSDYWNPSALNQLRA